MVGWSQIYEVKLLLKERKMPYGISGGDGRMKALYNKGLRFRWISVGICAT